METTMKRLDVGQHWKKQENIDKVSTDILAAREKHNGHGQIF